MIHLSNSLTLCCIGYGEPVPSNDGSRLFTIFFIIFGIFVIFAGIKDFIHNNLPVLRDFLFCKSFSQQVTEDLEIGDFYHYRKRLVLYTVLLSLWIIIGSIAVKENEEWTWIEALYFMIETSSVMFLFIHYFNVFNRLFFTRLLDTVI